MATVRDGDELGLRDEAGDGVCVVEREHVVVFAPEEEQGRAKLGELRLQAGEMSAREMIESPQDSAARPGRGPLVDQVIGKRSLTDQRGLKRQRQNVCAKQQVGRVYGAAQQRPAERPAGGRREHGQGLDAVGVVGGPLQPEHATEIVNHQMELWRREEIEEHRQVPSILGVAEAAAGRDGGFAVAQEVGREEAKAGDERRERLEQARGGRNSVERADRLAGAVVDIGGPDGADEHVFSVERWVRRHARVNLSRITTPWPIATATVRALSGDRLY